MYKKSALHVQSCFVANQTYCCFFTVLFALAASITRVYILFEQTINIIENFAFSPG